MPAIQPPAKVLVSGVTGYIAAWVVQNLLERGYAVRGTARSVAKGSFLEKRFAAYHSDGRFEIVVVEDIAKVGAFDEAVKGVDAIAHTASPVSFNAVDPDELIKPAVNGTVGLLESVLRDRSTKVKRIMITSSVAAIIRDTTDPITLSEADWNDQSLEILKKYEDEGRRNEAPNLVKYRVSKTLAERSAWEFVNSPENKPHINWDLVVLNPPMVFGPAIHEVTTPDSLNTSAAMFYNYVADITKSKEAGSKFLSGSGSYWIDVRDLAEAHALALEKEAAGGERILIAADRYKWQDFIDAANDLDPPPKLKTMLPVGVRGAGKIAEHLISYDLSKSERILGLKRRTMAEVTRDTFADYESRGW